MLKVGDVVICHGWKPTENKKGFIEEIIIDPSGQPRWKAKGQYSVYGLEQAEFTSGKSYYFGDYLGEDLEPTGESMSKLDLEKLKWELDEKNDKGFLNDIDKVVKNLGRERGRNEPQESMWSEVKKSDNKSE